MVKFIILILLFTCCHSSDTPDNSFVSWDEIRLIDNWENLLGLAIIAIIVYLIDRKIK